MLIDPIAINLGFKTIELWPYSTLMTLAAIVVFTGSLLFARKRELNIKKVTLVLLLMVVAMLFGARLLYFVTEISAFKDNYFEIFSLSFKYFSMFGGLILSILVGILACKYLKLDFWKLGDTVAPFLGLGIAIIRLGCFLNGCCFGKETDLPWGITYPAGSKAYFHQLAEHNPLFHANNPVHPTQLYEAGAALIGSMIAVYIIKKNKPAGLALLFFALWFTFFRLINHFFRISPDVPYFYPMMYIALLIITVSLIKSRLHKS